MLEALHYRPQNLSFRQLKIVYSWKCNAACDHCAVYSGPGRTEVLDRELAFCCVDLAARSGIRKVEYTGGEIFLFYTDLLQLLDRGSGHGLTAVVDTNGFWAKSHEVAVRRLRPLAQRGLQKITLSADRYHQPFVPLPRIVHALSAARELGLDRSVTLCSLENDPALLETVVALRPHCSKLKVQPVTPFGRGADRLPRDRMARCSFANAARPCNQATSPAPTVCPDGRVTLCCAPPMWWPRTEIEPSPLVLGWLDHEPLDEILRRAQGDPWLTLLAAEGLAGILRRLKAHDRGLYPPRSGGYFGACDLCMDVLGSPVLLRHISRTEGELHGRA